MRYTFKLMLAGDGGVGKSSLVNRYVNNTFHDDTRITLGVQFMVKRLNIEGHPIDLQIWDFGGEDRFRFILPAYCRGAHGAIFMYDITSPPSLYHIDDWMGVLRSQNGKFPVVVGGTKADLYPARKVELAEVMKEVGKFGIADVTEVSAKTGQNVDLLFEGMCRQMMAMRQEEPASYPLKSITLSPQIKTPR